MSKKAKKDSKKSVDITTAKTAARKSQDLSTLRLKGKEDDKAELKINTPDTALVLLSGCEDEMIIMAFRLLERFGRKHEKNVVILREKGILDSLLERQFFIEHENIMMKRFALHVEAMVVKTMDVPKDLNSSNIPPIMDLSLRFYLNEDDEFCTEYSSTIINKCFDDPDTCRNMLEDNDFLERLFTVTKTTENPDVLFHSYQILRKLLQQCPNEYTKLTGTGNFPTNRFLFDLTNTIPEIRYEALKIIKLLLADTSENSVLKPAEQSVFLVDQLSKALCESMLDESVVQVVEVMAMALQDETMAQTFFELDLFDRVSRTLEANFQRISPATVCLIGSVFTESAKYLEYLGRMHEAKIPDLFLDCLLTSRPAPSTHVITGLNRMMKFTDSADAVVNAFDNGVVARLLHIMQNDRIPIHTWEQAAELIGNLLVFNFLTTAVELMRLNFPAVLANIFGLGLNALSVDYILSLLSIVENLAQNNEFRSRLAEVPLLTRNIMNLLKNSFSTAVITQNIFQCLCTLVDEENVRSILLSKHISTYIMRGLKSLANLVKISVTNFIIQTTKFPDFVEDYVESGVLEVLIMHQKHSFCVPRWNHAIESILSKCPTMKFCIRNHLSFTDTTVGYDFLVSKCKFDDFRHFQRMLQEDVSPLHPVLVVNFEREKSPSELVINVPQECFSMTELLTDPTGWCFCRKPGDRDLPQYLSVLKKKLKERGLFEDPQNELGRTDFDNVAERTQIVAKVVSRVLSEGLKSLDLNSTEECSQHAVKCHLRELSAELHCNFIPLGMVRSGCQFERAILFKCLADQIGLPCTLNRGVHGCLLYNEVPLPIEVDHGLSCHKKTCDKKSLMYIPRRMLRPTHIVDLMFNVGELYPIQSRQALQYLRLF